MNSAVMTLLFSVYMYIEHGQEHADLVPLLMFAAAWILSMLHAVKDIID